MSVYIRNGYQPTGRRCESPEPTKAQLKAWKQNGHYMGDERSGYQPIGNERLEKLQDRHEERKPEDNLLKAMFGVKEKVSKKIAEHDEKVTYIRTYFLNRFKTEEKTS